MVRPAIAGFSSRYEPIALIYHPTADLNAPPVAPSTGYQLGFTNFSLGLRDSSEEFNQLYTGGVPTEDLEGLKPVNGTVETAITLDTAPHELQQFVGEAVTTGGPDFTHTHTLGTPLQSACAFADHREQAATYKYRNIWGCRYNTTSIAKTPTGAITFSSSIEGLYEDLPSDVVIADTLVGVPDTRVDMFASKLFLDSDELEGISSEWTMEVNHRLQADRNPVCYHRRTTLSRTNPKVTGTFGLFANDYAIGILRDHAHYSSRVPVSFTWLEEVTPTRSIEFFVQNAKLFVTSQDKSDEGDYDIMFSWTASGADCLVVTVKNQVASYPAVVAEV